MKHELSYSMRGIVDPLKRDGKKLARAARLLEPESYEGTASWASRSTDTLKLRDVGTPRELPYQPDDDRQAHLVKSYRQDERILCRMLDGAPLRSPQRPRRPNIIHSSYNIRSNQTATKREYFPGGLKKFSEESTRACRTHVRGAVLKDVLRAGRTSSA